MDGLKFCVLVAVSILVAGAPAEAQFPEKAMMAAMRGGSLADELKGLASMPVESQKFLLRLLGARLATEGDLSCNFFGGESACQMVDAKSQLASTCKNVNADVDCAFESSLKAQMVDDPADLVKGPLREEGFKDCPSCTALLHDFWCAQSAPTCGTFDRMLTEMLPVLHKVVAQQAPLLEAVSDTVPRMLQAYSLGLPCREMCRSITATCGCNDPETFGEVMTTLIQQEQSQRPGADAYQTHMSEEAARKVFSSVWGTDICDLFAPQFMPGFNGVCHPHNYTEVCDWCDGSNRRVQVVWEQIVAGLSQSISAITWSGVQRLLDPEGARKGSQFGSHRHDQPYRGEVAPKKEEDGPGAGWIVFWIFFSACLLGSAGGAGWYVYEKRKETKAAQYLSLTEMGYSPPAL